MVTKWTIITTKHDENVQNILFGKFVMFRNIDT